MEVDCLLMLELEVFASLEVLVILHSGFAAWVLPLSKHLSLEDPI